MTKTKSKTKAETKSKAVEDAIFDAQKAKDEVIEVIDDTIDSLNKKAETIFRDKPLLSKRILSLALILKREKNRKFR